LPRRPRRIPVALAELVEAEQNRKVDEGNRVQSMGISSTLGQCYSYNHVGKAACN
jgi:hypothetical protein